ncbi:MAG: YlxR family protein [Gloeobacterales cyanobacterium]
MKKNYRRCLSCRKIEQKSAFLRVVRSWPSQTVQLGEGMGRSVYFCPTVDCLQGVERKGRLAKALKAPVPPAVLQTLWEQVQHHRCPDTSFSQEAAQKSAANSIGIN